MTQFAQFKSHNATTAVITSRPGMDNQERERMFRRGNDANHGTNWYVPAGSEYTHKDYMDAVIAVAKKRGRQAVIDELFDPENGRCVVNCNTKLVFVPADVSAAAMHLMQKIGEKTSILVCVNVGFLYRQIRDTRNRQQLAVLFDHMAEEHNAKVFIVGEFGDPAFANRDVKEFIQENMLNMSGGDNLTGAINNARHALARPRHKIIVSRTLYLDDNYEGGRQAAKDARAAPLISQLLYKCPKCHEQWRQQPETHWMWSDNGSI